MILTQSEILKKEAYMCRSCSSAKEEIKYKYKPIRHMWGGWRRMGSRKRYPNSNLDVRVWPHRMGHGTYILENQYKSIKTLVKE